MIEHVQNRAGASLRRINPKNKPSMTPLEIERAHRKNAGIPKRKQRRFVLMARRLHQQEA